MLALTQRRGELFAHSDHTFHHHGIIRRFSIEEKTTIFFSRTICSSVYRSFNENHYGTDALLGNRSVHF
jgi:hypothetical protein